MVGVSERFLQVRADHLAGVIQMPLIDEEGNRVIVETEADEPDANAYQGDSDISNKEFRYNPPMHSANLSKVADFGNVGTKTSDFYDEDSAPKSYKEQWAKEGLNTLRLGRIIQHYQAPGQVSLMDYRWGFRFLYNPSSVTYVSSRNDSFVIDPRSETNRVLSGVFQNFQNVSFTVLLDRLPDVMSGIPSTDAYSPTLSTADKSGLLRYGTHWDMEALFKICNGEWNLTDRGKTSNIGILMPSNARLILGPGINFYGFIGSVTWKDELFSADMVPVRTRLDIVFKRHVDMTAEQAEDSFPGIATAQAGNEVEEEGGGGGDYVDTGGGDTSRTDREIPSGYKNGRSTSSAVAYATSRVGKDADFNRRCLAWVSRQVFQGPTRNIGHAYQVWDNSPARLHHSRDWGAPRGALVLWSSAIGDGSGHIAVSLGDGKMATTAPGGIQITNIKGFSDRGYLGWMPPYFVK